MKQFFIGLGIGLGCAVCVFFRAQTKYSFKDKYIESLSIENKWLRESALSSNESLAHFKTMAWYSMESTCLFSYLEGRRGSSYEDTTNYIYSAFSSVYK